MREPVCRVQWSAGWPAFSEHFFFFLRYTDNLPTIASHMQNNKKSTLLCGWRQSLSIPPPPAPPPGPRPGRERPRSLCRPHLAPLDRHIIATASFARACAQHVTHSHFCALWSRTHRTVASYHTTHHHLTSQSRVHSLIHQRVTVQRIIVRVPLACPFRLFWPSSSRLDIVLISHVSVQSVVADRRDHTVVLQSQHGTQRVVGFLDRA